MPEKHEVLIGSTMNCAHQYAKHSTAGMDTVYGAFFGPVPKKNRQNRDRIKKRKDSRALVRGDEADIASFLLTNCPTNCKYCSFKSDSSSIGGKKRLQANKTLAAQSQTQNS